MSCVAFFTLKTDPVIAAQKHLLTCLRTDPVVPGLCCPKRHERNGRQRLAQSNLIPTILGKSCELPQQVTLYFCSPFPLHLGCRRPRPRPNPGLGMLRARGTGLPDGTPVVPHVLICNLSCRPTPPSRLCPGPDLAACRPGRDGKGAHNPAL